MRLDCRHADCYDKILLWQPTNGCDTFGNDDTWTEEHCQSGGTKELCEKLHGSITVSDPWDSRNEIVLYSVLGSHLKSWQKYHTKNAPKEKKGTDNFEEGNTSSTKEENIIEPPRIYSNACSICLEFKEDETVVHSLGTHECPHVFHETCMKAVVAAAIKKNIHWIPCPCCRQPYVRTEIQAKGQETQVWRIFDIFMPFNGVQRRQDCNIKTLLASIPFTRILNYFVWHDPSAA